MSHDVITCEELVTLTTEYFEGALDACERLRVERHLATCPPCRGFLSQMRHTLAVAGSMPPQALSEETRSALLDAYRRWKTGA